MPELKSSVSAQDSRASRNDLAGLIPSSYSGASRQFSASPKSGLLSARFKRALEYIDTHLDENISLAELAQNSNLSIYYFASQFKKAMGVSPHRFILHRRVHRARQLLRNTSLTVLDVSLDLGFQHQNNFARAFRRVTGMTPTSFRRGYGPEDASGK